jgi:hypothetical protein
VVDAMRAALLLRRDGGRSHFRTGAAVFGEKRVLRSGLDVAVRAPLEIFVSLLW